MAATRGKSSSSSSKTSAKKSTSRKKTAAKTAKTAKTQASKTRSKASQSKRDASSRAGRKPASAQVTRKRSASQKVSPKKTTAKSTKTTKTSATKTKKKTSQKKSTSVRRSPKGSSSVSRKRSETTNDTSDLEAGTSMHDRLERLGKESSSSFSTPDSDMENMLGLPPLPGQEDAASGKKKGLFSRVFSSSKQEKTEEPPDTVKDANDARVAGVPEQPADEMFSERSRDEPESLEELDAEASSEMSPSELKEFRAMEKDVRKLEDHEKKIENDPSGTGTGSAGPAMGNVDPSPRIKVPLASEPQQADKSGNKDGPAVPSPDAVAGPQKDEVPAEKNTHPVSVPGQYAREAPHEREQPLKMEKRIDNGAEVADPSEHKPLPESDGSFKLSGKTKKEGRLTKFFKNLVSTSGSQDKKKQDKKKDSKEDKKAKEDNVEDTSAKPGDEADKQKGIFSNLKGQDKDDNPIADTKPGEEAGQSDKRPENVEHPSGTDKSADVDVPAPEIIADKETAGSSSPDPKSFVDDAVAAEMDTSAQEKDEKADPVGQPDIVDKPGAQKDASGAGGVTPEPEFGSPRSDDEDTSGGSKGHSSKDISKLQLKKEKLQKEVKDLEKEHERLKTSFDDKKAELSRKEKELDKRHKDLDERENILLTLQTDLIRERKELDNREFKLFMSKQNAEVSNPPNVDLSLKEDMKSIPQGLSDERMKLEQMMNQTRTLAINNDIDMAKKNYNRLVERFQEAELSPNDRKILHLSIRELYNDISLIVNSHRSGTDESPMQ